MKTSSAHSDLEAALKLLDQIDDQLGDTTEMLEARVPDVDPKARSVFQAIQLAGKYIHEAREGLYRMTSVHRVAKRYLEASSMTPESREVVEKLFSHYNQDSLLFALENLLRWFVKFTGVSSWHIAKDRDVDFRWGTSEVVWGATLSNLGMPHAHQVTVRAEIYCKVSDRVAFQTRGQHPPEFSPLQTRVSITGGGRVLAKWADVPDRGNSMTVFLLHHMTGNLSPENLREIMSPIQQSVPLGDQIAAFLDGFHNLTVDPEIQEGEDDSPTEGWMIVKFKLDPTLDDENGRYSSEVEDDVKGVASQIKRKFPTVSTAIDQYQGKGHRDYDNYGFRLSLVWH